MKARIDDGLWIVEDEDSRRWWTVSPDRSLITSAAGRTLNTDTRLGKQIIAATEQGTR